MEFISYYASLDDDDHGDDDDDGLFSCAWTEERPMK